MVTCAGLHDGIVGGWLERCIVNSTPAKTALSVKRSIVVSTLKLKETFMNTRLACPPQRGRLSSRPVGARKNTRPQGALAECDT